MDKEGKEVMTSLVEKQMSLRDYKIDSQMTGFCIKILDNASIFNLYHEPKVQFASNKILRDKGLTTIDFTKSDSIFSYFKTEVCGKTLR
jgi:hypothetical protein